MELTQKKEKLLITLLLCYFYTNDVSLWSYMFFFFPSFTVSAAQLTLSLLSLSLSPVRVSTTPSILLLLSSWLVGLYRLNSNRPCMLFLSLLFSLFPSPFFYKRAVFTHCFSSNQLFPPLSFFSRKKKNLSFLSSLPTCCNFLAVERKINLLAALFKQLQSRMLEWMLGLDSR